MGQSAKKSSLMFLPSVTHILQVVVICFESEELTDDERPDEEREMVVEREREEQVRHPSRPEITNQSALVGSDHLR